MLATKEQFIEFTAELNELMSKAQPGSVVNGLRLLAVACAGMLDVYAKPNTENPDGMCDSPTEFRKWFAQMVIDGGLAALED